MLDSQTPSRLPKLNEVDGLANIHGKRKPDTRRRNPPLTLQVSSFSLILVYTLVVFLCTEILLVNSHPSPKPRSYVIKSKNTHIHVRRCKIFANPPIHTIMDKLCTLCHDTFSHINPNMRSDCRSNCFQSEHFRTCLNIFNKYGTELEANSETNNVLKVVD